MQCRQCEYTLWEIHGRVCPECGHPFKPSEYEFTPNTVRFCCPHCDQSYYGTDDNGHLVPRAFRCVKCAADIEMDEMVLSPAHNVPAQVVMLNTKNPWERRRGFGFFRAWFSTVTMALLKPAQLMRQTSPRASLLGALWFAVFSNILYFVIGSGLGFIAIMIFAGAMTSQAPMAAGLWFSLLVMSIFGGVALVLGILIWGLVAHTILRITGGTRHGVNRTLLALCYSSGANALHAVPIIGFYLFALSWVWWAVSATLMLREGQRVSGLRAAIAAVAPPLIGMIVLIGGFYLMMIRPLASYRTNFGGAAQIPLVTDALVAAMQTGQTPLHAAALVADGRIGAYDLVTDDSNSYPDTISIGALTLEEVEAASLLNAEAAVRVAAAALPADVVAHRVGDFVFTYHGIDIANPDHADRWIVICWPDPDVNPAIASRHFVWIGDATGMETVRMEQDFQSSLDDENQARRDCGLPEIPHPRDVLHSRPIGVSTMPAQSATTTPAP